MLEASGDVLMLKNRNAELTRRVKELERVVKSNESETVELHRGLAESRREIDSLKAGEGRVAGDHVRPREGRTKDDSDVAWRRRTATGSTRVADGGARPGVDVRPARSFAGDAGRAPRGDDWPRGPGASAWSSDERILDARERMTRASDAGGSVESSFRAPRAPVDRGKGIRIIDDVQLVPASGESGGLRGGGASARDNGSWRKVVRRRRGRPPERGDASRGDGTPVAATSESDTGRRARPAGPASRAPARSSRAPRPAIVTITTNSTEMSYADILRHAREKVSLTSIGINNTKIRSAANGGIVIEVPGLNGQRLPGLLQTRLESVLSDKARVRNPSKWMRFVFAD